MAFIVEIIGKLTQMNHNDPVAMENAKPFATTNTIKMLI